MKQKQNLVLEHMYRDADNYKTRGLVIFEGSLTKDQQKRLFRRLQSFEDGFIPSQIGLDDLQANLQQFDSKDWDSDHCIHELIELHYTDNNSTDTRTAKQFYDEVMKTKFSIIKVGHILNRK